MVLSNGCVPPHSSPVFMWTIFTKALLFGKKIPLARKKMLTKMLTRAQKLMTRAPKTDYETRARHPGRAEAHFLFRLFSATLSVEVVVGDGFVYRKEGRLRLAGIVMASSALREYRSVLIALDVPPHPLAPHYLSLTFLRWYFFLLFSFFLTFILPLAYFLPQTIIIVRASLVDALLRELH